jgi:hypothetical protein
MRMSTVSAVPQGDESFEQGGQRGGEKACLESRFLNVERKKAPLSQLPAGAFPAILLIWADYCSD